MLAVEQGGFRRGLDTTNTIFDLVEYINTGFNQKDTYCLAAFADLAKAFDSLDRSLLIKKLELYGVKGSFFNFISNYLTNRTQQVNLNGVLSDLKPIRYGVPQGSILGPLLFIIFINDLPIHKFNRQILIYADDTVLYFRHNNLQNVIEYLESDLVIYNLWCLFNRLSLNIKKTKLMLFVENKRKTPVNLPTVTINDMSVDYVNNFCYLGVNFDTGLKFQGQLQHGMSKLNHKLLLLSKIRPFIDSRTVVTIYKSHLLSFIEYGSIFIDHLPVQQLSKLQRIQNKGLKISLYT